MIAFLGEEFGLVSAYHAHHKLNLGRSCTRPISGDGGRPRRGTSTSV